MDKMYMIKLAACVTAALMAGIICSAAFAGPQKDVFSRTTTEPPQAAAPMPNPATTQPTPGVPIRPTAVHQMAEYWFENFDHQIASHKPTPADRTILGRPFNKEVERVIEWTNTATNVAKNYRDLSKKLRELQVPASLGSDKAEFEKYRNLTADWYDDSAQIFEDLIRPRRAAKTQEELEAALSEVNQRSVTLGKNHNDLKMMDSQLRAKYGVHAARHDDAIQKYVRSVLK